MLRRLVPVRLDNEGYRGTAVALWLFGTYLVVEAIMSVRGAIATRVAATNDGILLDGLGAGGAETILFLFRSLSIAGLPLVAIGVVALWRWRAMVPFLYLVLLGEQVVRRVAAAANPIARNEAGATVALWINLTILAFLCVGLALSLWSRSPPHSGGGGSSASRS